MCLAHLDYSTQGTPFLAFVLTAHITLWIEEGAPGLSNRNSKQAKLQLNDGNGKEQQRWHSWPAEGSQG